MLSDSTNFIFAFLAGLAAFLTPCFWPVWPIYLSIITGYNISEIKPTADYRRRIFWQSLSFVAGFALVFFFLGLTASLLGQFLRQWRLILQRVGGIFLLILGAYFLEWFKNPVWYKSFGSRPHLIAVRSRYVNIFLSGATFALGWTPCIGPVLASILIWTGVFSENLWQGAWWLLGFTLGLAVPFVLLGVLFSQLYYRLSRHLAIVMWIHKVAGWLIVLAGLLLLIGWWNRVVNIITLWFSHQPSL